MKTYSSYISTALYQAASMTAQAARELAILNELAYGIDSSHDAQFVLTRILQDFRRAYEIQVNLLPKEMPSIKGYEVAGKSIPAQMVGGDYFDFIEADPRYLSFCVGDVSGKGLPASLLMANVQATIRALTLSNCSAKTCVETANKLLYHSTNTSTFVTLFYGILDTQNHLLRYVNAGHNRPMLFRAGRAPIALNTAGLLLSFMPNWVYQEEMVPIACGDLLVVYSDGVTEAMNRSHELFGEERLTAIIEQHRCNTPQHIIDQVLGDVRNFAGNTPQADDITLLVIKH